MRFTRIFPLVFVAGFALAAPDGQERRPILSDVNSLVGAVTAEVGSIISEATSVAVSLASEATSLAGSMNAGVANVRPLHISVPVLTALTTTAGSVMFGAWVGC